MNAPSLEITWQWIDEYSQGRRHWGALRCQLRRYQRFQLSAYPGASFLAFMDRTEPIEHWINQCGRRLAPTTARAELGRVKGFTAWLFQEGRIAHDVLFYVSVPPALRGDLPALYLRRNLQRTIEAFGAQLPQAGRHSAVQVAHQWNLHLNCAQSEGRAEDDEDLVFAFLQKVARQAPSEQRSLSWLRGLLLFFEFQVQQGQVGANLLPEWIQRYQSRSAMLRVLATASVASLSQVERPPFFKSGLATQLQDFVQHQRDRGKRYDSASYALRVLDRILQRHQVECASQIGPSTIEGYLREDEPSPRTRNKRLWLLKLFLRFLSRRGLSCPVPVEGWPELDEPAFRPHLFTLQEVGRLLAEADRRGRAAAPAFRGLWKAIETIFFLLYGCGLRLSEPLKLRNQDVDLHQRVLFIARTKFYKQRWVPFGQGATRRLAAYKELRDQLFPRQTDGQRPFFLNSRGRAFTKGPVQHVFRCFRISLGLVSRGSLPAPRIHDLRHSFAISRLYKWYSDGAEVQNKLPLLATYLGHLNYHSTELYLHLAEDLLRQGGRQFEAQFMQIVQRRIPDETP